MSYTATDFYKDELNRLEAKQKNANNIMNSQERLAKLNDSYRKRYAKYVQILMVLILAYIVYLGMIILQKQIPSFPEVVVDVVTVVIIFAVAIYLFSTMWELYSRSIVNYDELDIAEYDSSGVDVSDLEDKEGEDANNINGNVSVCVGNACCDNGFIYDSSKNKCVIKPTAPTSGGTTFTTLEYTQIEHAYTSTKMDSSLKREPNAQNVKPTADKSSLISSNFVSNDNI